MPALGAGIHVLFLRAAKTWMAGTSPAMTQGKARDVSPRALLDSAPRPNATDRCAKITAIAFHCS
jgi:hypothetical protein